MRGHILGIGTAVPGEPISQGDALDALAQLSPEHAARRAPLDALYRRAGITTRHGIVLTGEGVQREFRESTHPLGPSTGTRMEVYAAHAPTLAIAAATQAIEAANLSLSEVTHLVTVTCTGFSAPGVDIALISGLGLDANVERTMVGFMGCHGALNGLRVASAYAASDPSARVLVVAVEVCSVHVSYQVGDGRSVSNSVFADGAAAAVVGAVNGRPRTLELLAHGATIFDDTEELMTWRIGDHGFEMTLSALVPSVIEERLKPWLTGWLHSKGVDVGEVGRFAVHPGGPRILDAAERALALPHGDLEASRQVFTRYGNMSSPTLLFILDRLRNEPSDGRPVVALGFGPGLAVEVALLR